MMTVIGEVKLAQEVGQRRVMVELALKVREAKRKLLKQLIKIVMQARPVEKTPRRSQPKMLGRQRRKGLLLKRRRKKERKKSTGERCVSLLQF